MGIVISFRPKTSYSPITPSNGVVILKMSFAGFGKISIPAFETFGMALHVTPEIVILFSLKQVVRESRPTTLSINVPFGVYVDCAGLAILLIVKVCAPDAVSVIVDPAQTVLAVAV